MVITGLELTGRKAGMRENKQRTFDDFIAVAQTLIRKKYTKPSRLGIYGYSNGGFARWRSFDSATCRIVWRSF